MEHSYVQIQISPESLPSIPSWFGEVAVFAQILAQWIWNLRLELGQALSSSELRTTEFAKASVIEPASAIEPEPSEKQTLPVQYGPPQWARPSFTGGFPGSAFTPQPDGTLRCPANHPLYPQERRPERDGSLRVLYAARIGHLPPRLLLPRPPTRLRCCLLLRYCGKTGPAVTSGEHGSK